MIPPRQPAVISKVRREFFIGSSVRRVFRRRRMLYGSLYTSASNVKPLAIAERSLKCSWRTVVRRSAVSICRRLLPPAGWCLAEAQQVPRHL
jgi:hypothetical protein